MLRGALALMRALDEQPLKLVVGVGSIDGVTGMPGNAWHAFANQALDVMLADLGARRPDVSTLMVNYGAWTDTGIDTGTTSGSERAPPNRGAITSPAGIVNFLGLVLGMPPAKRIVVASDLSGLESWQAMLPLPDTSSRFAENVVRYQPGVDIVCRTTLSLERDPYLQDHAYHGVYLFPTVFGLEAMAACAQSALGMALPPRFRFENVRFERPVIVSESSGANIEIHARVRQRKTQTDPIQVDAFVVAEQTGYRIRHMACTVVFAAAHETRAIVTWPTEPLTGPSPADLYDRKLFQGPLFRRINALYEMDWWGAITRVEATDQTHEPTSFVAGDPYFRDGLLQTSLLTVEGDFLPVEIERIECHASRAGIAGAFFVRSDVMSGTEHDVTSEVTALAADGRIVERMIGYRMQRVPGDVRSYAPTGTGGTAQS